MTSRERLLAALGGEQPDSVPVNCYELVAYDWQSWYNQRASYKPLMDMVREKTDCVFMASLPAPPSGNAADAVRGVESQSPGGRNITTKKRREGKTLFIETTYHTPKGELKSSHRIDDDIFTVWTLEHMLKSIDDIDKYLSFDWGGANEFDLTEFATVQTQLGQNGIMMPSLTDAIGEVGELFELSRFLVLSITETARIKYFLDFIHQRQIAYLEKVLQAGADAGVNWAECLFRICGPEYATPPHLSPEYFAMFVTPYVRRMSDILHQYGAKVRLHCHGKLGKVLDEIMKTEPDAMDPIEPPPDGDIELGQVKKQTGGKVCLFGNIEMRLLERGEPEEVRDFVIDALAQAKKGGRFVIMPTAAPINDPLSQKTQENYAVFIETALEYGSY